VDTDAKKLEEPKQRGIRTFDSMENAIDKLQPDFWDICIPTEFHYSVTKLLLETLHDPKILIEKPVCNPSEITETLSLKKKYPNAKIAVNENLLSSQVTQKAKEFVEKYKIKKPEISVESSKNRIRDILEGRFIDKELGVLGYEAPHMITCASGIIDNSFPNRLVSSRIEDMKLPDGRILEKQGLAELKYSANNGLKVYLYTSMDGRIGIPITEFNPPSYIFTDDRLTRYRVMKIKEGDIEILCQYEPLPGFERNLGRAFVKRGNEIIESELVPENSMKYHLTNAVRYFAGEISNPSNVEDAVSIVNLLYEAVKYQLL
jgi:hypothetical protein